MTERNTCLDVYQAEIRGELRTTAAQIKGLIADHHAEEMAHLGRLEQDTERQWTALAAQRELIGSVQSEVVALRAELKGRGVINGRSPTGNGREARLRRLADSQAAQWALLVVRWKAALLALALGLALLGHLSGWWTLGELRAPARKLIGVSQ